MKRTSIALMLLLSGCSIFSKPKENAGDAAVREKWASYAASCSSWIGGTNSGLLTTLGYPASHFEDHKGGEIWQYQYLDTIAVASVVGVDVVQITHTRLFGVNEAGYIYSCKDTTQPTGQSVRYRN